MNLRPKIRLVISDLHLSRGAWLSNGRRNPLEDFHEDARLVEFLDHYSTEAFEDADVELIINGDFFDPLSVIPIPEGRRRLNLEYPLEVEESAAIDKFASIVAGHPRCFDALRRFMARGKSVVIRWGNHDAALLWPKVQEYVRGVLAPRGDEKLVFMQEPYVFDRICIDHGHRYEMLNHFDETNMFIERKTPGGIKRIQNLPFGSFFVLGFLNRVKLERPYINLVQPFGTYLRLALIFDPFFAVSRGLRVAWFFIKMRFITHPMRFARLRKTLGIMGEVFRRPSLEAEAEDELTGPGSESLSYDTLILGHNHQAAMRVFANGRQYINTGTWTPITSLDMSTLGHRVMRTYALIEYVDGKAQASLKIWNGKPQISEDFK